MSRLILIGEPAAVYDFIGLPTWNKTYKHWSHKANDTAVFRRLAFDIATQVKEALPEWERSLPLVETALLVIYVYPPYEEISDIHNVNIKAITDGFTDAGIWEDDEWAFIPATLFLWGGIDENKERRVRVEVHELDGIYINGVGQLLPAGRIRLETKK